MCTMAPCKCFSCFPLPHFASCPFSQMFFASSGFPAALLFRVPAIAWVTHGPHTVFQSWFCPAWCLLPSLCLHIGSSTSLAAWCFLKGFCSGANTIDNIVVTSVPPVNLTQNILDLSLYEQQECFSLWFLRLQGSFVSVLLQYLRIAAGEILCAVVSLMHFTFCYWQEQ